MRTIYRLLVINPSRVSTGIAVYDNEKCIVEEILRHDQEQLSRSSRIIDQVTFRKQVILDTLHEKGMNITRLSAVVGRGGNLGPIPGGTYEVNAGMLEDLRTARFGEHEHNSGAIIAYEIADRLNIPAFTVDPASVDEFADIARVTGMSHVVRKSQFPALSHKAAARRFAREVGMAYEECNLIVAYLGREVSVGAHCRGRVIDVSHSSISGYLGTDDVQRVEHRMDGGDRSARLIYEAMAYQVCKEIGAAACVLAGRVDGVVLTGRLASSPSLMALISGRMGWIAPVKVIAGVNTLLALAEGGLRVLRKEEPIQNYPLPVMEQIGRI